MTAERIANSIMQDKSFDGHYVLIEGKKDVKLYRRFIDNSNAKVKVTFGKHQLREVFNLLDSQKFEKKIGIRDADFLRIPQNAKFDPNYSLNIFPTDCHDSEIMAIESGALDDFFHLVSEAEKVQGFEEKYDSKVSDLLLNLLYPLGCLKLANKRHSLGLCFKPEKVDGNKLKLSKFISTENWSFKGNEAMVKAVMEYSVNRNTTLASKSEIMAKLDATISNNYEHKEIVHGHDASEFLYMLFKDGLKSKERILQDAGCVETILIGCVDLIKFTKTQLHKNLLQWQTTKNISIFNTINLSKSILN